MGGSLITGVGLGALFFKASENSTKINQMTYNIGAIGICVGSLITAFALFHLLFGLNLLGNGGHGWAKLFGAVFMVSAVGCLTAATALLPEMLEAGKSNIHNGPAMALFIAAGASGLFVLLFAAKFHGKLGGNVFNSYFGLKVLWKNKGSPILHATVAAGFLFGSGFVSMNVFVESLADINESHANHSIQNSKIVLIGIMGTIGLMCLGYIMYGANGGHRTAQALTVACMGVAGVVGAIGLSQMGNYATNAGSDSSLHTFFTSGSAASVMLIVAMGLFGLGILLRLAAPLVSKCKNKAGK